MMAHDRAMHEAGNANDKVLLPYLRAADEATARDALAALIECEAAPLAQDIIRAKLRVYHFRAGAPTTRDAEEDAADVYGETLTQLLTRLEKLKHGARPERDGESKSTNAHAAHVPRMQPIYNFRSYVAVLTYHVCYKFLRDKFPARQRLKNRLRYLLSHDAQFSIWETETHKEHLLCGLRAWRTDEQRKPATDQQIEILRESLPAVPHMKIDTCAADKAVPSTHERARFADLLRRIFLDIDAPIELDSLVNLIANAEGIETRDYYHSQPDATELQFADERVDVASEVEQRMFLQNLWAEVCELPVLQRAAILLNLRDERGQGCLWLMPTTGVASMRDIARSLDVPAEELARWWNELPFEDQEIARRLGITRQQVINLRKAGRSRLTRRLRRFFE